MSEINPQPLPPQFAFRPRPFTDPIWMEYLAEELDNESLRGLTAIRLETVAAVHAAIAEGAQKAAEVVRSGQAKG